MKKLIVIIISFNFTSCSKPDPNEFKVPVQYSGEVRLIEQDEGQILSHKEEIKTLSKPEPNVEFTIYNDVAIYELEDCCWFTPSWVQVSTILSDQKGKFKSKEFLADYREDYKIEMTDNRYHFSQMVEEENTKIYGVYKYFEDQMEITIIDNKPQTNEHITLSLNMYTNGLFGIQNPILNEGTFSSDSTQRIYKISVKAYTAFNSKITFRNRSLDTTKEIVHYTGKGEKPNDLIIEYNE